MHEPDDRRAAQHLPREEVELVVVHELADEVLDVVHRADGGRDPPEHHAGEQSITISAQR